MTHDDASAAVANGLIHQLTFYAKKKSRCGMPTFFLAKGRFNLSEIVLRNRQNGKTMIHESPK
jgi:hypothetical protein